MYGYNLRNEEKSGYNMGNNWGDENQGEQKHGHYTSTLNFVSFSASEHSRSFFLLCTFLFVHTFRITFFLFSSSTSHFS